MSPSRTTARGSDPCLPIQVDLSAMLDGELDPASIRRVMVHSDVCPSCRAFLDGIRQQVRWHRSVAAVSAEAAEAGETAANVGSVAPSAARLREQLTENSRRLAQILYELGRCFVLTGLSAEFSREVAKEPVPLPDMAMRGRNLLDEVSRGDGVAGPEWVAARELFDGQLRSPDENLAKGQRLLVECLALDAAAHDARIYLGLVHYVRGQRALARKQFAIVLAEASDARLRAYALANLGNIHLDEGDTEQAVTLFQQVVDSGVLRDLPNKSTAYFNLGLAYGLSGRFADSMRWFERLYQETPHRCAWAGRELGRRGQFLRMIQNRPEAKALADAFPTWFPTLAFPSVAVAR